MSSNRTLRAFLVLVPALLVGGRAHAAGVETVDRQHSLGAAAFFLSTDETRCVDTAVFVVANADTERVLPAPETRSSQVAVVISQIDLCTLSPILTGNGSAEGTVVVSPNLRKASVTAVVPVLNLFNGTLVDVLVDLEFEGTSIMIAEGSSEVNPYIPGYLITTSFDQTFRHATAIGSVTSFSGELTPEPSIEAMIQNVRVGTVVIAQP